MRAAVGAAAIALALVASSASAEPDHHTPSRHDVQAAQDAAASKARDVAAVRADLVLANQRLQESAVRAAQATEAWNGARYELRLARKAATAAEQRSDIASADLQRQRDAYASALTTSYELGPSLSAVGAMVDADGIETVIERTTTVQNAADALDAQYDEFTAAATIADVATDQARDARAEAQATQVEARHARDVARGAADEAAAQASAIAEEKDRLIGELAELQDISHKLAQRRQTALEAKAAAAAAAAAQAVLQATHEENQEKEEKEDNGSDHTHQGPTPGQSHQQNPGPTSGGTTPDPATPAPTPTPQPPAPNPTPPAPAGGAPSAIAFARSHVGDPYRWGAAGPGAWDCSGLTMGAWRAGGKTLPHYSVAQYEQSTPIQASSLQAGDLVFWGSSSDPSSIYHVALYVGGGQIIHAPRTGRPVTEESMYYWTPPNFYARP